MTIQTCELRHFGPEKNVGTSWINPNEINWKVLIYTDIYSRMNAYGSICWWGDRSKFTTFLYIFPISTWYTPIFTWRKFSEWTISTWNYHIHQIQEKPKIHSEIHQIELPSTIFTWNLKICFFLVPRQNIDRNHELLGHFRRRKGRKTSLQNSRKTKGWMPKMMCLGKGGSNLNMAIFGINSVNFCGVKRSKMSRSSWRILMLMLLPTQWLLHQQQVVLPRLRRRRRRPQKMGEETVENPEKLQGWTVGILTIQPTPPKV